MTGELVALTALQGWAGNHVGQRAIVLDKVQIDRRQVLHRMAEIARQAQALEKNFGQHDRGAEIQVNPPAESRDDRGERAEIQ